MSGDRNKIIIVDDVKANLTMGRDLLKDTFEVYPVPSAQRLFELLQNVSPELILLDIEMPEMNGYEAIKRLKADNRYEHIPVIFLTSKDDETSEIEGFDLGAADYVTKPFSGALLIKRINNQLLIVQQKKRLLENQAVLQDYADNLVIKVRDKTTEVVDLQNAVLSTVADLVESRDKVTGGHISRTQQYLGILLEEMLQEEIYFDEVNPWDKEFFLSSAQLHDVGKIAISDAILNKPGKLDAEEFETMKTHVKVGVGVIRHMMSKTKEHAFLEHALLIAAAHHEKWDGTGYPEKLRGASIPLEGRLMAIVDVYDALVSERPYKKPFSHEEACGIIEQGAGSHFDPALVEVFKACECQFAQVAAENRS